MSLVTKTLHRQNYAAIDAASPEQSQEGRTILITGGTGVIGRRAAEAFVTAGADLVVITSRDAERATRIAAKVEAAGNGRSKVRGYQMELRDAESVKALWESMRRDGIEPDVMVLNTTDLLPPIAEDDKLLTLWNLIETGFKNQLINVDNFRALGPKKGKVLLYVSTNATHIHQLSLHLTGASSPRMAMTRMMSDLAMNTPVEEMQIISIHPGFVLTDENKQWGYNTDIIAPAKEFDNESLTANFYVWASTKKAAFLHGRFLWTAWDVEELMEMRPKFEADLGFLRLGLQGVTSQDFEMLTRGMARAV